MVERSLELDQEVCLLHCEFQTTLTKQQMGFEVANQLLVKLVQKVGFESFGVPAPRHLDARNEITHTQKM